MKINELREIGKENLKSKLVELKKELIVLNAKRARGTTLEKPALIRNTRRTIARILTLMNSKNQTQSVEVVKKK
ncbi:50S ribosomal protein L29 [Candidatus Woesearchaeota archaeon]|nr:50S ribosomal protein L29 [Candidatus Woesearchaeota archaeon]